MQELNNRPVKTFEFFTADYSAIIQKESISVALDYFKDKYGHGDIIAIIEHDRGKEFLSAQEAPDRRVLIIGPGSMKGCDLAAVIAGIKGKSAPLLIRDEMRADTVALLDEMHEFSPRRLSDPPSPIYDPKRKKRKHY